MDGGFASQVVGSKVSDLYVDAHFLYQEALAETVMAVMFTEPKPSIMINWWPQLNKPSKVIENTCTSQTMVLSQDYV